MIVNLSQIVPLHLFSNFSHLLVNSHSVVISSTYSVILMIASLKCNQTSHTSYGHYREFDDTMVTGDAQFVDSVSDCACHLTVFPTHEDQNQCGYIRFGGKYRFISGLLDQFKSKTVSIRAWNMTPRFSRVILTFRKNSMYLTPLSQVTCTTTP